MRNAVIIISRLMITPAIIWLYHPAACVADKDKQHNDDDDLIGNRVQKFPEVGHEISFSCDVAVDKVGAATKHKHYARRDFMIRKIHEI